MVIKKESRRFNGKLYYLESYRYMTKKLAQQEAKRYRRAGHLARVVPSNYPGRWFLYVKRR